MACLSDSKTDCCAESLGVTFCQLVSVVSPMNIGAFTIALHVQRLTDVLPVCQVFHASSRWTHILFRFHLGQFHHYFALCDVNGCSRRKTTFFLVFACCTNSNQMSSVILLSFGTCGNSRLSGLPVNNLGSMFRNEVPSILKVLDQATCQSFFAALISAQLLKWRCLPHRSL